MVRRRDRDLPRSRVDSTEAPPLPRRRERDDGAADRPYLARSRTGVRDRGDRRRRSRQHGRGAAAGGAYGGGAPRRATGAPERRGRGTGTPPRRGREPATEAGTMNPAIFREYDIRGVADRDYDADFARRLGVAYAVFAGARGVRCRGG